MTRFTLLILIASLLVLLVVPVSAKPSRHDTHTADPVVLEFVEIGRQIAANPDPPAAPLWEKFAADHADHDLGQLARFLVGLEKLRQTGPESDPASLATWFTVAAPKSGAPSAFRQRLTGAGRGMVTRLKILMLGRQLRAYYRTNVEYPQDLGQLIEAKLARPQDLLDAMGRPLGYEPRARAIMPDEPRQAYTLSADGMRVDGDDLASTLKAVDEPIKSWQLESTSVPRQEAYVQERRPDGTWAASRMWKIGEKRGELVLWAVFDEVAVTGSGGVPRVMLATQGSGR